MTITKFPQIEFPFAGMKIEDSFFIPSVDFYGDIYDIQEAAREAGVAVRCRMCLYEEMTGIRVWVVGFKKQK